MKKHLFVTGILVCILMFTAETARAQAVTVSIDNAIRSSAEKFSEGINSGSKIAVLSMRADSTRMSNYLIEEITSAIVNQRIFTVVDRAQLDLIREEMNFQLSEEVSDASAQAIGQKLGAQYIVTGTFEPVGNYYRYRVRIIEVETAAIHVTYSANVKNDQVVASLAGYNSVSTPPPPPPRYYSQDFTTGERWGTFGLNWLVPGLGSYVIMKDKVGGTVQLVVGGAGTICYMAGFVGMMNGDDSAEITLTIGSFMVLGNFIYNIVRSSVYRQPGSRTASVIDPEAWNIAVLPGKDGIEQVSLSYTLRF